MLPAAFLVATMVEVPEGSPLASTWDVVVIGGGAAGLMSCLELPAGLRVLLLSKDAAPRSASRWAQGGIAAVTRPEDSFASHRMDTLRAGCGLCDPDAVELLVHQAPACVERLLQLGMDFDRDGEGLSTTLEAAHSHRRVLHAQDRTGGALVDALEREVRRRPDLEQRKGVMALELWVDGDRCRGVLVLEGTRLRWLRAGAVVLASGGGGHLFANTTNPPQATGDGVVMAWQAGAALRDLEFVQFHPTALMLPGAPHFLISEAVRGEGARLVDDRGQSPVSQLAGGDLAPRDQVSRALVRCMQDQRLDHVWLDLRPVGKARLERQFPTILRRCRDLGLDPCSQPVPVAPAAHYWMGGVSTDLSAATSLRGLYAVGEVACTGVHGANRLASNSLMECLVFARQLGRIELASPPSGADREPIRRWDCAGPPPKAVASGLTLERLRQLCWRVAAVERRGDGLRHSRQRLRQWADPMGPAASAWGLAVSLTPGEQLELGSETAARLLGRHELRQQLILAQLLMEAAGFRQESRGGHYRLDAPAPQPFWARHTVQRRGAAIATSPLGGRLRGSPSPGSH
jgi:L-aspartate oxidase